MWPCLPIKQMPFGGHSSADVPSSAWVLQRQAILLRSDGLLKDLVSKTSLSLLARRLQILRLQTGRQSEIVSSPSKALSVD